MIYGIFFKLCGKKKDAPEKCAESLKVNDPSMEESATEQAEPKTEEKSTTDTTANRVCTVCFEGHGRVLQTFHGR